MTSYQYCHNDREYRRILFLCDPTKIELVFTTVNIDEILEISATRLHLTILQTVARGCCHGDIIDFMATGKMCVLLVSGAYIWEIP